MNENRLLLIVVLYSLILLQSTASMAEKHNFPDLLVLKLDTALPVKVISDDKMNIMIDFQKEIIAIQWKGLNKEDRDVVLSNSKGNLIEAKQLFAGSTLVFFETQTLYEGDYILKIRDQSDWIFKTFKLIKPE